MNFFKKTIYGLIKKNRHLNQEFYAKIHYEYYHGKKLDLIQPIEFCQKLQWLKVYYHLPILNQLVDKFAVRKYIEESVGKAYLNEVYGVYDNPDEIAFESLPNQFVIKATHSTNSNIIVKDKFILDINKANKLMRKWLRKNLYYSTGQEWAYKNVKPRILIEKLIVNNEEPLMDYRFYCFSGLPRFIQTDVYVGETKYITHFDLDWNKLDFNVMGRHAHPEDLEKPKELKKMIEIAVKLAGNHPFVRVDLFYVQEKIICGELTFYPSDGRKNFVPEKYNRIIGDYIKLPKIPEGQKEIISQ